MPGQDQDEQADQESSSEGGGEEALAAEFLQVDLPERKEERVRREIGVEISKQASGLAAPKPKERLGEEVSAWGEGAVSRGELEEVWDDDPSAPSTEEEDSEELEEDDEGKLRGS